MTHIFTDCYEFDQDISNWDLRSRIHDQSRLRN